MRQRIILRYSDAFKRGVIKGIESGRFSSIEQARVHYGIEGSSTIQKWLRKYGKTHLQAKVVRVEQPDEADRVRELKRELEQYKRALGETQTQNVLNCSYLKLACGQLGQEVEAFKKKCDGRRSTGRRRRRV